ncbi:MAG: valine--tRNA ligase, partial [Candidatus Bathyarchaeota archaeon]
MLLDKHYNPKSVEPKWQKFWEERDIYKFDHRKAGSVFSIDTPPPYVSAAHLHVGHAMSYVQAEIIVRYWRMKGYNIFYPMGFDDNGLPTERYVEKKYSIDKSKTSRSKFIKLCLKETELGRQVYEKLWRNLAIGVDWSLSYNTIGALAQETAQRSFIDLYKKGLVYRKKAPSFWCTQCGTALAQADLEDLTEESFLYDIEFKLEDETPIIISTTRPEFIPACVALYANPRDKRYDHFINKIALLPLFNQPVPIKTSEAVDIEKGTGLIMVCTWGDVDDIEKWKKDNLETKLLIDQFGKLTNLAGKYQGLSITEARKKILADLKKKGLLKNEKTIQHTLNVHERCGTPAEFFSSPQWFIKLIDFKNHFLKRGNELKWYPQFMKRRYEDWILGLRWDWGISRSRYYGVPFPVWYCENCGEVVLSEDKELPVDPRENHPKNKSCSRCNKKKFVGESDVMDTWMTSSLTPLINAKWGEKYNLMDKIYPMSLRVQGFEIIRTWLFYTIVKSHFHTSSLPWNAVMISGWGLDSKGRKMSKSKGNFVTSEEMIEKYSADALRFWSCGANLGMNLRFTEDDVKAGQKLLTKIWNVTRFILMNLTGYEYRKEDT